MYTEPSPLFLRAHRASNTRVATAEHTNLITGDTIKLKIADGSVTVDASSETRRSLSLSLPNEQSIWDQLDTVGSRIKIRAGVRYTDRKTETVPLGTFILDDDSMSIGPDGLIQMTCPDLWLKLQRNGFGPSRSSVPTNMVWQEIKRLVEGAFNAASPFPGWSFLDQSATTKVGQLMWEDGKRDTAVKGLCDDNGLDLFFDADGMAVLRKVPMLTPDASPVWTIEAGDSGILRSIERSRTRSDIVNALRITTSASDVTFPPVWVMNQTAGDPYSVDGPLGMVVQDWSSANFRNSAQARTAGLARLSKLLGIGRTMSLSSASNPLLDAYDVFSVVVPRIDKNLSRPVELAMIDQVTHPLTADGVQDIQTRSTRPTSDAA